MTRESKELHGKTYLIERNELALFGKYATRKIINEGVKPPNTPMYFILSGFQITVCESTLEVAATRLMIIRI